MGYDSVKHLNGESTAMIHPQKTTTICAFPPTSIAGTAIPAATTATTDPTSASHTRRSWESSSVDTQPSRVFSGEPGYNAGGGLSDIVLGPSHSHGHGHGPKLWPTFQKDRDDGPKTAPFPVPFVVGSWSHSRLRRPASRLQPPRSRSQLGSFPMSIGMNKNMSATEAGVVGLSPVGGCRKDGVPVQWIDSNLDGILIKPTAARAGMSPNTNNDLSLSRGACMTVSRGVGMVPGISQGPSPARVGSHRSVYSSTIPTTAAVLAAPVESEAPRQRQDQHRQTEKEVRDHDRGERRPLATIHHAKPADMSASAAANPPVSLSILEPPSEDPALSAPLALPPNPCPESTNSASEANSFLTALNARLELEAEAQVRSPSMSQAMSILSLDPEASASELGDGGSWSGSGGSDDDRFSDDVDDIQMRFKRDTTNFGTVFGSLV